MKKIRVIIGAILIILGITLYAWQSGAFLSEEQKYEKKMAAQVKELPNTMFSKLPQITLDQAYDKIKNKEDIVIYFGWVKTCGDALNFQVNSFDYYLDNESIFKKIYVVNLDEESPDALMNHDLRKPIAKRFQIDQWTKDESLSPMELKSPQLVHYKDGKIHDLVSWTPLNSDSEYGIIKESSDEFFTNLLK